jgi:hypothetical protein
MPLLPDLDRYGSIYTFYLYYGKPDLLILQQANCFTAFIYLFILIELSSIFLLGRYDDQFVVAAFDNAPTVDSEMYSKMDKSVRDLSESRVSYVAMIHVVFISNSIFFFPVS